MAAPLHRLVAELGCTNFKKRAARGAIRNWTKECHKSFEALKTKLTTAPLLSYVDFSEPFILEVDASHGGLGAVLLQKQGGKIRPIAYASRGLRPTERNMLNYSSMKLEFLMLKWTGKCPGGDGRLQQLHKPHAINVPQLWHRLWWWSGAISRVS